jgi:signal transduction histidine kinase
MSGLFKYTPPAWCTTSKDKSKYKLCHNVCLILFLSMFPVIIMNYVFNFHHVWFIHWVTVFVFGVLLLLFRMHVLRIEITTNLFLATGVIFIGFAILSSDIIRSPIMPWFGIVPLFAFWLLDARHAFFWLIVSALCYVFFLVLALNNYSPDNKYDFFSGSHAYYAVFGLFLLLLNVYVIGSDFEKKKKIAIDEINQTNDELVEALTDLKKAKEELEQAQKHKDIFIAQMSHEMRTPMNAICGVTELLSSNTSATKKELISILSKSSLHLLNIINDILDLSKLQNGKFQIQTIPYLLDELIQDVYSYAKKGCDEKGLRFGLSINAVQNLHLLGDPYRIKQILNNILSNAIKFTEKGTIDFSVVFEEKQKVVVYTIKDTGIGMTEDEMKRLFTPFSQANETIHIKYGGTGIGLCISRQLAEIFGGTIKLESQYRHGTSFTITIPVKLYDLNSGEIETDKIAVTGAVLKRLTT